MPAGPSPTPAIGPTATNYVGHIRADTAALGAAARQGPLDAPVAACPGWDVARLTAHVGTVHRWATLVVSSGTRPDRSTLPPPPEDPAQVAGWLDQGLDPLTAALGALDGDAPVWNFSLAPDQGRFWPRRQAHETAVHRWDAQRAVGQPDPIDRELALDGIAEVLDTWAPTALSGRDGIDIGGSLRLQPTDPGAEQAAPAAWTLRTDDGLFSASVDSAAPADVTVTGTASDLLLLLWRRLPADDPSVSVEGDAQVLERWLALGVP